MSSHLPTTRRAFTKRDLVRQVAHLTGLSYRAADQSVSATLLAIRKELDTPGARVALRGFGAFEARVRRPRRYRDPVSQTWVLRPAMVYVHFKAAP